MRHFYVSNWLNQRGHDWIKPEILFRTDGRTPFPQANFIFRVRTPHFFKWVAKNAPFSVPSTPQRFSCDFNLYSGEIIATSHDLTPNGGGLVREIPLFQGNLGEGEILFYFARCMVYLPTFTVKINHSCR